MIMSQALSSISPWHTALHTPCGVLYSVPSLILDADWGLQSDARGSGHRHVAVGGYRHHCVEPVQKNYDMVKAGVDKLNFSDAIVVSQAAITISSDPPMVRMALPIPAKIGMVGIEGLSIDPTRAEGPAVPALSVDEYVEQQSIEQLDALMIDAEGWDAKVLFGATKTLGSLQPPYMEFEVRPLRHHFGAGFPLTYPSAPYHNPQHAVVHAQLVPSAHA